MLYRNYYRYYHLMIWSCKSLNVTIQSFALVLLWANSLIKSSSSWKWFASTWNLWMLLISPNLDGTCAIVDSIVCVFMSRENLLVFCCVIKITRCNPFFFFFLELIWYKYSKKKALLFFFDSNLVIVQVHLAADVLIWYAFTNKRHD